MMSEARRPYRQSRRVAQTHARRGALVAIAARLIERDGFRGLSLEALAGAAGVTRRTVYNQLGSKLGLLEAVMDDLAGRARASEFTELASLPDPGAAMLALFRANARLWSVDRALHRRLVGLASVDPEAAAVVAEREARRAGPWRVLVDRLEAAGGLRGVPPAEALRALVHLSSFPAYDALAGEPADLEATVALLLRLAAGVAEA
jgi:AcrR family transcriptional regulator